MMTFTAILAAAIPTAMYTLFIWWLDRYEKEPLPLLVVAFLWGALPAIGIAIVFELVLQVPLANSPLGPDIAAWGIAPLIEEPVKALALVALFWLVRSEFDGPLDGIVYGSLIGFGFSMTENLLYFVLFKADVAVLFWVRCVLFGLNHAFFTSVVGVALGMVRYQSTRIVRILSFGGGLALAILFHSLHNYVVRYQSLGLFFAWLVQSSGVIVVFAIAVLSWRHERRWIEQELGDEVRAGVISASEYAEIVSPTRRMHGQIQALFHSGWARYWQTRRLHQLATELAFCKSQLRLEDRHRTPDEQDRLRGELTMLRLVIGSEE